MRNFWNNSGTSQLINGEKTYGEITFLNIWEKIKEKLNKKTKYNKKKIKVLFTNKTSTSHCSLNIKNALLDSTGMALYTFIAW